MVNKRFSTCLLLLVFGFFLGTVQVNAYIDHRNVRIDSLEMVLHSSNPPKGQELVDIYSALMRAYLPINSERCEYYARKVLQESYKVNGLALRQSALNNLGLVAYGNDRFDEAHGRIHAQSGSKKQIADSGEDAHGARRQLRSDGFFHTRQMPAGLHL